MNDTSSTIHKRHKRESDTERVGTEGFVEAGAIFHLSPPTVGS